MYYQEEREIFPTDDLSQKNNVSQANSDADIAMIQEQAQINTDDIFQKLI